MSGNVGLQARVAGFFVHTTRIGRSARGSWPGASSSRQAYSLAAGSSSKYAAEFTASTAFLKSVVSQVT